MNIPRSSLRTGRYCKFTQLLSGSTVIELQFYYFSDRDRLRVGSVTPNSLNGQKLW